MFINCEVKEGLTPELRVVYFVDARGQGIEVVVAKTNLSNNRLMVRSVTKRNGEVLIELPAESTDGRWRIWMKE